MSAADRPDEPDQPEAGGPDAAPDTDHDHLDVDAEFARIVAGWEPTVPEDVDGPPPPGPDTSPDAAPAPGPAPDRAVADRAWDDELLDRTTWDDEGHFVPPPPPPLPVVDPRRKAAWGALLGAPLLALVLLVAGVAVPGWLSVGLVLGFVGGFGYLVATMRSGPPDTWSGDDGARL